MSIKNKKKLTLRIDSSLIFSIKEYAAQHNTSVSRLVEHYFRHIAKEQKSEEQHTSLVEALTGILPQDVNVKTLHQDHILEKYGA